MRLFLLFILFLLSLTLFAQEDSITVSGTVYEEETGVPFIAVTVLIKGTMNGTMCDIDGKYSIRAKSSDILHFSFIGCITQKIRINGRSKIDVYLKNDSQDLGLPSTYYSRSHIFFSAQLSAGNNRKGWMGEAYIELPYWAEFDTGKPLKTYDKIKSYVAIGFKAERLNPMKDKFKTETYLEADLLKWLWHNNPKWNRYLYASPYITAGYYIDADNKHIIQKQDMSYGAGIIILTKFNRWLPNLSGSYQTYKRQSELKHYNLELSHSFKGVGISLGHQWFASQRKFDGYYIKLRYSFPLTPILYY